MAGPSPPRNPTAELERAARRLLEVREGKAEIDRFEDTIASRPNVVVFNAELYVESASHQVLDQLRHSALRPFTAAMNSYVPGALRAARNDLVVEEGELLDQIRALGKELTDAGT